VRLRFLGSGDPFGSGGRGQACLLLEGGAAPVLLDCGATSMVALARAGVDPRDLAAVVVSHLHGDHFGGLPFLLFHAALSRRTGPLTIAGPTQTEARVDAALVAFGYPPLTELRRSIEVEFVPLVHGRRTAVGPAAVTAIPVDHGPATFPTALRVAYDGRTVAYSGDTAWTDALIEVARDADLLVAMAYTYGEDRPGCLSYRTLAARRADLACRRLLLTHPSFDLLAHRAEIDPAVAELAEDGTIVEL
jgi:ribonuclease BN (tRNA processing enzyme)